MAIIIAEKPRELKWGDLIRILRKEADNCDFPEAERAYGELLGSGIVGNTAVVNGMPKGKFYLYEK